MTTRQKLNEDLTRLGLQDRVVAVHSSLSSFGHVDGGAEAVVDALLQTCNTVLMPSYSLQLMVPSPGLPGPDQNGMDGCLRDALSAAPAPPAFDPNNFNTNTPIDRDMGLISRTFLHRENTVRSAHPTVSWAANGDHSRFFTATHPPDDPLRPIRKLCEADGYVLLLGVALDSCTALHLAEEAVGRRPFIRWVRTPDGGTLPVRQNGCIGGAAALKPQFCELQRETLIDGCTAIAYPVRPLVEAAASLLRHSPSALLCSGGQGCPRCLDAFNGGPAD